MKYCVFLFMCLAACTAPVSEDQVEEEFVVIPYEEHYANGGLKIKGQNAKGLRHGVWYSYYENGMKWSEEHYVGGKRNGLSVSYFPTGIFRYKGSFHNDERSGKWYFYDENGKIIKEEIIE